MKYKLKKEARQFFKDDLQERIMPIESWAKETISINLLDEVDQVYVEYGINTSESSKNLQGWSSNKNGIPTAHFNFTIHVRDIENDIYDKIEIPEVMDEIQKSLNKFFKRYLN